MITSWTYNSNREIIRHMNGEIAGFQGPGPTLDIECNFDGNTYNIRVEDNLMIIHGVTIKNMGAPIYKCGSYIYVENALRLLKDIDWALDDEKRIQQAMDIGDWIQLKFTYAEEL